MKYVIPHLVRDEFTRISRNISKRISSSIIGEYKILAGNIDISALTTPPEKNELETAKYFVDMGKNVTFLRPSSIPNQHRPDILMDGVEWEIKAPTGSGKRNIEYNFRKAITQSKYIIFDLRHVKMPEQQCIAQLETEFSKRPYLKKLFIIKKTGELLTYPQK